jgi:ketosteroid isomerase-like protein
MSSQNVELFNRALTAMNEKDVDAFLAVMDDEVEAAPRIAALDGVYRGPEGIRSWWNALFGVFPGLAFDVVELRDLEGDLTIAAIHLHGSGAGSDIPIDETAWHVAWWQHGKCTRWGLYDSEAEALTAVRVADAS